jgi:hypothetical protein
MLHENPKTADGPGDLSITLKYGFLFRNEEHGNAILTGFLAGSIPTGTYKNGSSSAIVTPTLAGGKGWGKFDVQSALGGTLPVNIVDILGLTIVSNSAFQVHAMKKLRPEAEINLTFWEGGFNNGKKQTFLTPRLIFGRFPIHKTSQATRLTPRTPITPHSTGTSNESSGSASLIPFAFGSRGVLSASGCSLNRTSVFRC